MKQVLSIFLTIFLMFTQASIALAQTAIPSDEMRKIDAFGTCREVTNTFDGARMMVPSDAPGEWSSGGSSFLANPPPTARVTICCDGTEYGGACWYFSRPSENCIAACSGHGGVDAPSIVRYGSGGSNAMCNSLLDAMGNRSGSANDDIANDHGVTGCHVTNGGNRRRYTLPTDVSSVVTNGNRACACQF